MLPRFFSRLSRPAAIEVSHRVKIRPFSKSIPPKKTPAPEIKNTPQEENPLGSFSKPEPLKKGKKVMGYSSLPEDLPHNPDRVGPDRVIVSPSNEYNYFYYELDNTKNNPLLFSTINKDTTGLKGERERAGEKIPGHAVKIADLTHDTYLKPK